MWIDIASIITSCVMANHLGMIDKIEEITHKKMYVINCVKCFSFWSVLIYCLVCYSWHNLVIYVAISFLSSYLSIWLDMMLSLLDNLLYKSYETINYTKNENIHTKESDTEYTDITNPMFKMWWVEE